MSTEPPGTPDRSVLGESWVVASTTSIKEHDSHPTLEKDPSSPSPLPRTERKIGKPANKNTNLDHDQDQDQIPAQLAQSLTSSSSSWTTPGPELVMPSIYEIPVSEASWVAPNIRPAEKKAPQMRKRRRIARNGEQIQQQPGAAVGSTGSAAPDHRNKKPSVIARLSSLCREQRTLLLTAINALLVALIMHLLFLPELIYQAQGLCAFPTLKALYPASCVPLEARALPSNPFKSTAAPISPEETIIVAQNNLQSIFTTTLSTLTPLSHILKESESMLSNLQSDLQTSLPDARNALALEFQGSNAALRAAAWEFDSLRADLRSAVDSLLASPLALEPDSAASIARDTRLAAQLRRRAEYLDRLRAQIGNKAESLGERFATLDDHLEAVDGIVSREARRASLLGGPAVVPRGEGLLHLLSSYARFSARLFGAGASSSTRERPAGPSFSPSPSSSADPARPTSTLALLRLAATQHHAVADEVSRLARALRDKQRPRLGPTW
ncbi:uncharacterized protein N7482_006218 [Penicillium canariense]|uniref:Uncharacterized protein n=1 Tax=Penicillium canariense TaxID=189055 RepID=A0A9W9I7V7_9EURO|nr:uncharacterized protein N7482_006218 [Penicillium canariense]KAJ5167437.1 hypothetical protein N7482_006218 [Penicillium canariense]